MFGFTGRDEQGNAEMDITGQLTQRLDRLDGIDVRKREKEVDKDPANRKIEVEARNRRHKDQVDCIKAIRQASTLNHIFTINKPNNKYNKQ